MATSQCSLCGNSQGEVIESFKTSEIQKGYKELCGHEFHSEFQGVSSLNLTRCKKCGLKYFSPVVAGSSQFYSTLQDKLDWYYLTQKNEYTYAAQCIEKDFSVLEVGCGEGSFSNFAKCREYVGLELNAQVAKSVQAKGLNVKVESLQDHAQSHPRYYDVVCGFQVLEHIPDVKSFIRSASQCLKKNGLLILSTPNGDSFLKDAPNVVLNMPPHHQTWWTEDVFKNLAKFLDFELIEIHHERLSEEHRIFYLTTFFNHNFNHFLGKKHRTLDHSLTQKAVNRFSRILAKGTNPLLAFIKRPKGFSITAVMRLRS